MHYLSSVYFVNQPLHKSYCSTVHYRRIISIYQPTNAHIISHKTFLKHFKTLRHVSILSDHHQGALFLAKVILQYSQFNSYLQTYCCGSISCCVGMCCGSSGYVCIACDNNTYKLLWIYSIPPDDGLQICPKYVEVEWNELRMNSVPSWFSLHGGIISWNCIMDKQKRRI